MSVLDQHFVAVRGASRAYAGRTAVAEASLTLRSGEITCLLGPSGCGKSTLLRLIAGLEPVDGGEIEVDGAILSRSGATIPPERRGIGLVFQDFALFPHLTALQNVCFGLNRLTKRERHDRALILLDQLRIADRAHAWPHMLSGGEQQRVALARALARRPSAVLLDEPFSGLDGDLKAEVRKAVVEGLRLSRAAVLIVTHDPEEALLTADNLALMHGGRVLQCGAPRECYLKPVSIEAARLLGETNLIEARVEGGKVETEFGMLPAPGHADGPAILMVRPEGVRLATEGAPARVTAVRFGGAFHELILHGPTQTLAARIADTPPAEGDTVRVALDPERSRLYPA